MSPAARRTTRGPTPFRSYPGKLPRGPHSLTREQVAANQRMRVGMAMLEAIGEKGYVATTVSDVVGRAGVSRKAFYQHFANKEECFLATYDAIAREGRRRVARAFSDAEGHPDRMETGIRAVFEAAVENPDALRLAITEITAVGAAGIERRERAIGEYGQLLQEGLRSSPGVNAAAAPALPDTTLRAMVGGLNRVLIGCLYGSRRTKPLELVPELAHWISTYHPPPKAFVSNLKAIRQRRKRAHAKQLGGRAPGTLSPPQDQRRAARSSYGSSRSFVVHNQRERILDAVTNLAASKGYGNLTVEDVAAEAAVSLQAFYEHFESKEDAFLVAYELGHSKGLSFVERAFAEAPDWRTGVRDGLCSLTGYLASEPSFARLSLMGATVATPRAYELSNRGVAAYARLLAPGFDEVPKRRRPPQIAIDAIAGGLQEMFLHYAVQGRIEDLPELTADATYVALAPFIGAQAAAQVAVEPARV
ncbi:MAG TPA: TetR/AcrR family transcriptional regulator [Solirubrobacteraceae bacterium]|nr:TetR/AcrR family transcriptional regulator [Solirubrobacteraceae bacterium]